MALSQLAQILGGTAVVIALVFGMVQIHQFRRQRHDVAAIELMPPSNAPKLRIPKYFDTR